MIMVELLSFGGNIRRDGVGNLPCVIWSCYAAMQPCSHAATQLCRHAGGSKLVRPRGAACSEVRVAVAAYDRGVSVAVQTLYGCPLQSRGNYRSSIQWATGDGHQIIILPVIGCAYSPNVEAWMWETATSLRKIIVCLTIGKEGLGI